MRTIQIPDHLFPHFTDWVREHGMHITCRDDTVTASERHGNGNIFPMPRRITAPKTRHNDHDPAA